MANKVADGETTSVRRVLITSILAVLCSLLSMPEACCKSVVLVSASLRANVSASTGLGRQTRLYGRQERRNGTASDALVPQVENPDALSIVQNDLMLVTVMAESSPAEKDHVTFWVDRTMAAMTVTVRNRGPQNCLLVSQFGDRPPPSLFSKRTIEWTVDTPRAGQWRVEQEGEGGYEVRVEGSSSENIEVTLYDVNIHTGLAVFVLSSPTAGHQIRTIIDVIGTDVIKNLYNMSLVTSEGVELASNWLRAAGGPRDPQYSSTFTWPAQAVYIRVYGEEEQGTVFERQTPFIITPILIDLQLQGGATSDVVGPEGSLTVTYRLLNHGPSDTFQLTAHSDTDVLGAVVSPATIRLGQQGIVLGSVSVTVPPYSSSATSGLLTVKVWSVANPEMVQSASIFLTFPYTVPDLDPPSCQTVTLTGNCTPQDVTSLTCYLRHWRVQVSVEDDVSGLENVTFSDVTKHDFAQVPPYEEGLSGHPLVISFRATCCRAQILLDIADVAGNERQCQYFQAEVPPPLHTPAPTPPHPTAAWSTTTPESSQPADRQVTSNASRGHEGSGGNDLDLTTGRSVSPGGSEVTVTANVTSSSRLLNETLVGSEVVTHSRGGKRGKGEYSPLTTASIILGSIGGSAGLCIALICLLLFCRHRRHLQQRRHSCNSNHSRCSDDGDCHHGSDPHHHHHHHHHRGSEGENGHNRRFHGCSHENSPVSSRGSNSYHGQGSSNSYRHHDSSSSSRNSNHRHHSDNSRNSHRHHGGNNRHHHSNNSSSDDHHHHSNHAHTDRRRNDAEQNQPGVWNPDSRHHHHSNASRSGASQYHHHSNGAEARVREHREGQRGVLPDVLPETESVAEFSTAL